jgi:DNA translocase FtsK/SpoIIIE-like protein
MGRKRANNSKKKAKAPSEQHQKSHRRFWRYCFVLLLTGAVVLAWLSMSTFSPDDPPSPTVYPPKSHVDNAAGIVGAYISHYLRYWLGGGVYMGLVFATVTAGILLVGGRINYLP